MILRVGWLDSRREIDFKFYSLRKLREFDAEALTTAIVNAFTIRMPLLRLSKCSNALN